MFDEDNKIFVIYIIIQEQKEKIINYIKKIQIKAQIRALIFDNFKVSIIISIEYFNYISICSAKNVVKHFKYTNNNYVIKLKKSKQRFLGPIYSLGYVEL